MRIICTLSLLCFTLVLWSPMSFAIPLTPEPAGSYSDFTIGGTTVAARPELAGVVLEDVLTPFSITGTETISGMIQNRVVRSDDDGTLDFYWRIYSIDAESTGDVLAFRVAGFEGFALDADWRIDGLGSVAPTTARYFGMVDGGVNFLFAEDEVGVREESFFFFLDTEATSYDMSGSYDLLGAPFNSMSSLYTTFAPAAPVPEPTTLLLLGSGLLGLIGAKRRKLEK